MEKWSREEIEGLLALEEQIDDGKESTALEKIYLDVISHLLQQLDEAEKRVAGECIKIIEEEDARILACQTGKLEDYQIDTQVRMTTVLLPGLIGTIRQKYGIGGNDGK